MNVMLFYTVSHYIFMDRANSTVLFLMFAFGCVVCTVLVFITPIYYSVKCVNEIKMISIQVNKMLDFYEDEKLFKIIAVFSRKILHRDRVISTIFFDIDWKLLFTVNLKNCNDWYLIYEIFISVPEFDFCIFDHHFSIWRRNF
jgi:hypothetical protein